MAKDYNKMSKDIVARIGGSDNVDKIMHCMTRLRMVVKDEAKVDMEGLKQIDGVINVVVAGGQYQVVIGTSVTKVYDAAIQNFGFAIDAVSSESEGTEETKKNKNPLAVLIDVISGVFLPILPGLGAVGILKGILVGLTSLNVLSAESDTYIVLYALAQVYQLAFDAVPLIACAILGLLWPITIVFGLHWGFIPIAIQQLSTFGYDSFSPITVASNFATMGALVGVFFKTKNKGLKELSGSAAFSAIAGGITEPSVYGVTLKYKKPFILC